MLLFAAAVDVLVAARTGMALRRREKGRGWIFYAALTYASPAWVRLLFAPFS